MKRILLCLPLLLLAGCEDIVIGEPESECPDGVCPLVSPAPYQGVPQCDPPAGARVKNYQGGSCVHASYQTALFWQGQDEWANHWRRSHGGGFSCAGLAKLSDRYQIPYALCLDGDPAFLDWCMRTRRICAIEYYGRHCVNLVHLDHERAGLLDNNSTHKINWIARDQFIRTWQSRYGGNAIAPLYQPAPPPLVVQQ